MDKSDKGNQIAIIAAGVLVAIGGLLWWNNYTDRRDCEERAQDASVDWYTSSEIPDVGVRQQLQKNYQQRYMEGC